MRVQTVAVLVIAICLACAERASAASPTGQALSVEEFQSQLVGLGAKIEQLRQDRSGLPDLLAAIPSSWTVRDGSMEFTVSTSWLRTGLLELPLEPEKAGVAAQKLHDRVRLLSDATKGYTGRRTVEADYRRLSDILARREFRSVSGPTIWDRIKQRVLTWMLEILDRIFGSQAVPVIGKTIVWVAIVAAVALLSLWVWRLLSRGASVLSIATDVAAVSAKPWQEWLAEARAAAQRGDWRDGVRLAYWAGISNLESRGQWLPDRARTPREYLRVISDSSEFRTPLQMLTQVFERIWYGRRPASADAFSQMLAELARMGCQ